MVDSVFNRSVLTTPGKIKSCPRSHNDLCLLGGNRSKSGCEGFSVIVFHNLQSRSLITSVITYNLFVYPNLKARLEKMSIRSRCLPWKAAPHTLFRMGALKNKLFTKQKDCINELKSGGSGNFFGVGITWFLRERKGGIIRNLRPRRGEH